MVDNTHIFTSPLSKNHTKIATISQQLLKTYERGKNVPGIWRTFWEIKSGKDQIDGPNVKINTRRFVLGCSQRILGKSQWWDSWSRSRRPAMHCPALGNSWLAHMPSDPNPLDLLAQSTGASNPAVPTPAVSASPGNLLAIQKSQALPRLIKSKALRVGPAICVSTSPTPDSDAMKNL